MVRTAPSSTAFVELAHALCDRDLHEEAEDVCRRGLELRPDLTTGYVALGRALLGQGKLDDAEAVLRSTVEIYPGYAAAYRWLAEVLVARGEPDRARAMLAEAATAAPTNRHIAAVLEESGRVEIAPPKDREPTAIANAALYARRISEAALDVSAEEEPSRSLTGTGIGEDDATRLQSPEKLLESLAAAGAEPARPTSAHDVREIPLGGRRGRLTPIAIDRQPTPPPFVSTPAPGDASTSGAAPMTASDRGRSSSISIPLPVSTDVPAPSRARRWIVPAVAVGATLVAGLGWLGWRQYGSFDEHASDPAAIAARRSLERALETSSLDELLEARSEGRRTLSRVGHHHALAPAVAFTEAFLSRRYALAYDADAQSLADALGRTKLPPERAAEVSAARSLLYLGRGNLSAARHHAATASRLAPAGSWTLLTVALSAARAGEPAEANRAYATLTSKTPEFLPGARAAAEHWIDDGDPRRALTVMRGVLERAPGDLESRLVLDEALRAAGEPPSADHREALADGCARAATASPALLAGCALAEAERLRIEGKRDASRTRALDAAQVVPDDPRLLGRAAQLLGNLGEIPRASALTDRARQQASVRMPAVAWAESAVGLGQGQNPRGAAGLPNGTPDARLVSIRAIAAAKGAPGVLASLRSFKALGGSQDPDFAWFEKLGRAGASRTPALLAEQAVHAGETPGPVGAYVLGTLAHQAGRRSLAVTWLGQALTGHGDACRAGHLYATVLRDLGRSPETDRKLVAANLRARGCTLLP